MSDFSKNSGSGSYFQINPNSVGGFSIYDLFVVTEKDALEIGIDVRAFSPPNLYPYVQGMKEQFTVSFPELTQAQYNLLKQLMFQTGPGVLFTVVYSTVQLIRQWDGVTSPGYTTNTDIGRIRNKLRMRKFAIPHWSGLANKYAASIDFEEA